MNGPSLQFNNLLDLVRDAPYQQSGVTTTRSPARWHGAYRHCSTPSGPSCRTEWKVRPNLTLTLGPAMGTTMGIPT